MACLPIESPRVLALSLAPGTKIADDPGGGDTYRAPAEPVFKDYAMALRIKAEGEPGVVAVLGPVEFFDHARCKGCDPVKPRSA